MAFILKRALVEDGDLSVKKMGGIDCKEQRNDKQWEPYEEALYYSISGDILGFCKKNKCVHLYEMQGAAPK